MKKGVHPKVSVVAFKCATCGNTFNILSTNKDSTVFLDVCSNCNPFYQNKNSVSEATKNDAKLMEKFKKGAERAKK
ncbi:MAG: 50S ribosomal protein L31 [Mycoplasmataceae bacterium]|jgi:large subunit ribosomal protein L31|nr:50S ribosomal protein L31 [Mycoplasmataceae bacterium]